MTLFDDEFISKLHVVGKLIAFNLETFNGKVIDKSAKSTTWNKNLYALGLMRRKVSLNSLNQGLVCLISLLLP